MKSKFRIDWEKYATSMQQCAEWGMKSVELLFPRLRGTSVYKEYGKWRTCLPVYIFFVIIRHEWWGFT
jgi:hypothetical protein